MSPKPSDIRAHNHALGQRWVWGIVLGLTAVVVVNIYVAYVASSSNAELERDDYYLASLHYQDSVDAQRRAAEQGYSLSYTMQEGLRLSRMAVPVSETVTGTLRMLRPDHAASDFTRAISFPLSYTDQADLADQIHPGRWHASYTLYGVSPTVTVMGALYIEADR